MKTRQLYKKKNLDLKKTHWKGERKRKREREREREKGMPLVKVKPY
jgi:hypothetical protein